MDLQLIRKLSILTTIWSSLFLAIILTNAFGKSTSNIIAWSIYAAIVGISFTSLKLWNKSLQEPIMDINLTYLEMSISVILAMAVSLIGGTLMQLETMQSTIWSTLLAFVMTTSQFTLLKVSMNFIHKIICLYDLIRILTICCLSKKKYKYTRAFNRIQPLQLTVSIGLYRYQDQFIFVYCHLFY